MRMRPRIAWRLLTMTSLCVALCSAALSASAATWTNTAGGNYNTAGNWSGGVPNAAGATADFSTLDISSDVEVLMDTSVTLGQLLFGDTDTSTGGSWFLGPNGAATPTITLDNSGSTPVITVNPLVPFTTFDDAFVATPVDGTTGLAKEGDGIFTFGAPVNITGDIAINGGHLRYDAAATPAVTPRMTMANGTILSTPFFIGEIAADAGATITVNQTAASGSNFLGENGGQGIHGAGTGENLNLNLSGAEGTTYSPDGNWDGFDNVNIAGLGETAPNVRMRPNGGGFNVNSFANSNLNLDNARVYIRTNSFGNDIAIGALSGNSTAVLAGGNAGSAARYVVGGLGTDSEFAGMLDGVGGQSINKVGAGTLTLSGGVNGVSPVLNNPGDPGRQGGVVRVTEGTIATSGTFDHFESGLATINSTVDVKPGAVLDVSGSDNTFHSVEFQQFIGSGTIRGNFDHQAGNINPGDVGVDDNDTDLTNELVPTAGTITFDGDLSFNGGTIVFDMNETPGGDDLVSVTGATDLGSGGVVQPSFLGGDPAAGLTYTFLSSDGGFTGTTAGWSVAWPGRGAKPTVVTNGNSLQFTTTTVGAVADIVWSGATNGDWDIETTQNWTLGGSSDVYFDADNVTFNDAGTETTVNVVDTVAPSSIVVDSSKNYSFASGGGSITGDTSLVKRGSSTLTMGLANSFTGGAVIEAGTVDTAGFPGALGTGVVELQSNTTLTRTGGMNNSAININGTGVTINNNSTGDPGFPTVTGNGSVTITTDDTAKTISMNATETFTGTVNFVPAAAGTLAIRLGGPASDYPNGVVNLTATSMANRNGSSAPTATFSYGEIHADADSSFNAFGGGSTTIPDAILEIGGLDTDSNFDGTINDGGGGGGSTATTTVRKIGTGELVLSGLNTYTGDTIVEAGTLSITNQYLADTADVYLTSGATFNIDFGNLGFIDVIDSLFIDGVGQATGTWGRIGSGADHENNLFTGDGLLQVSTVGTLPGDFDGDGDVDGVDFLVWQQGGSPNPGSQADLDEWAGNFGPPLVAAVGGNLGAVPEPATWLLALACGLGSLSRRKRGR